MKNKRRTQIRITEQQHGQLQTLAMATGLNISEHIRRAIDEYLERKRANDRHEQPNAAELEQGGKIAGA